MFTKGKPRKLVTAGVDIGNYSVKVIEAVSEQGVHKLTKFAAVELSSPTSEGLNSALKTAVEQAALSTKDIRISLSGPEAIVRIITMPEMDPHDLKNSLKYEADRYIPFNVDEVSIDSYILGKAPEAAGQIRVLLAAAKKDLISKRIKLFEQLGLNVVLIDINVFAILNAFTMCEKDITPENNVGILNLGHKYTNVIVCKGVNPYFTRDVQIGGEMVTSVLAKQLNMEPKEVFKMLSDPAKLDESAQEAAKAAFGKLCDEIRLSFGYFENQFGGSVDKIYLSGGLANTKLFSTILEEVVGIKPQVWDPLKMFTIEPGLDEKRLAVNKSALAVASGLVIREDV